MNDRDDQAQRIQQINDACRTTLTECVVVLTDAVRALEPAGVVALVEAVRNYSTFTEDNDPHREHDFGNMELFGETWFWKFDYYTPDLAGGSEDPTDTENTCRVLTILRADEY
jgi:hypothetical protein